MSFLAKLFLNGLTINLLDTNIQFYQQVGVANKPSAIPNGGLFQVTIEATATTDLLHLATAPDTMCKGYIRFYRRDGLSKLVDYEFFDTYIVRYRRNFDSTSGTPATDTLVFSPGILRIGDMVFEKPWKLTDLAQLTEQAPAPPEEKKLPVITDHYYEDLRGKKLTSKDLYVGDTVNLVLHSTDGIGEIVTVDLADNNRDFEYKGKILKGDLLEDVTIISSPQKFRLKIVEQQKEA